MSKKAFLHCSDSTHGCAVVIDAWHEARNFSSPSYPDVNIGYHAVVLNGRPYPKEYNPFFDGMVEAGRSAKDKGAHVRGYNSHFGICLIGKDEFTISQFLSARALLKSRGFKPSEIKGHYEVDKHKTCPNINMDAFREFYKTGNLRLMLPWIKRNDHQFLRYITL